MANKKKRSRSEAPREMAAVMFTDVRGYSNLAQRDEVLALRLLELKRKLAEPLFAQHHGRVVKTIGDAFMVEFRSALDAVRCAAELQKRLHKHNTSVPEKEKLLVRIGVHLGDVVRKGDDLLGDTVNIAARVEPQAEPGGVAFTQAVHDQIKGKFDLPLTSLGDFKLKGIDAEMPLYAVEFSWSTASPNPSGPGFFVRLKQHHMFRIASWYATAAYVLVLVANAVFPDIGLVREDVRYVIASLALGFPVALTVGWMFIPPSRENPERFSSWKRVRWKLGALLSIAMIGFVAASGVYLWRLNEQYRNSPPAQAADVWSVAVLPFEKLGNVDEALVNGIQGSIETTLGGLGSVRVIAHGSFPAISSTRPSLADISRSTGATYVIQGTIQRPDAHTSYTIHMDLISVHDANSLHSVTDDYAGNAPVIDLQQQVASRIAGPVRFMSRPDDWLAKGYPTTSNARAMQLLRQALMSFYYGGTADSAALLREALDLDPNFAQAHAYLAFFTLSSAGKSAGTREMVEAEISRALNIAPGLPEAGFGRARLYADLSDDASAARTLAPLESSLSQNFLMHFMYGRELRYLGRWDDAIREIQKAAAVDPLQLYTTNYAAIIEYAKRDYEDAESLLAEDQARWPLSPGPRLWRAQVEFAYRGDLARLASVVDSDWSAYQPQGDWVSASRIEVAHLEGKHAEVIRLLMTYPHDDLQPTLFWTILGRTLYVDSLAAESLRLMGNDEEAKQIAELHLPNNIAKIQSSGDLFGELRVALLQAFGGDSSDALKTIAPLLARLSKPADKWDSDEAGHVADIAVVLAWSGKKQEAIDLLAKGLSATWGPHAVLLAQDPVWRPLYKEPSFVKLLADHGQKLTYAH